MVRSIPLPRSRLLRVMLATLLVAAACGVGAGIWRYHLKRFQVVHDGVLIRVAQPTEWGLRHLVERRGVKTVLSLQLFDWRLKRGLIDFGDPDGSKESEFVRDLGANYVQWAMGEQACWPWPTPWQYEEFFRLFDNPANHPIAVHCMGGRHRAGTIAALFRLEYDRWTVEEALGEMYSFDFGGGIDIHELNLRTYSPRPLPSESEWQALRGELAQALAGPPPTAYADMAWRLGQQLDAPPVAAALEAYVRGRRPFGLAIAARVLQNPNCPAANLAAEWGAELLAQPRASDDEWSTAAAVVADFGSTEQQQATIARLRDSAWRQENPRRFDRAAAGIANRYTPNRVPYLQALLDNKANQLLPAASRFRYCDLAAARLAAIADRSFVTGGPPDETARWDYACEQARAWLADHPAEAQLARLLPPTGKTVVRQGDQPKAEDLRRMRR